ncbi:hypothetical protein [Jidongwangia harbinensis]|uniref:hypothetical protein n=1 Tax=Jidongwangia harbinensis TaxID=2878561 RepID=UPI001CD9AC21|nr:hypothetical protein [Jidongwangia harbinensis]MCA2212760.1 hypothetical protein [Jidongwangia harbinensis]
MEERRAARIGTLGGLALLAGATALIAASSGAHSAFATCLLSLLAVGMAHALLDEIRRQARRRSAGGWAVPDTVNTVLLGAWSAGALAGTVLVAAPTAVRLVGLTLSGGYALSGAYFVVERRRSVRSAAAVAVWPSTDLPGTELPGTDLPGADLLGTNPPGTKLPGASSPGTKLPGTSSPGTNPPGTIPPGSGLPGTSPPGAVEPRNTDVMPDGSGMSSR